METDDLLENMSIDIPMSNAYKLLCEDAVSKVDKKSIEKQRSIAQKLKTELLATKLKLKFSYKKLDFWTEHDVKHPLHHLQSAVEATTSSVPDFQWQKPKNITILEESGGRQVRVFVEIADELFGNRDHLNLTYPAKRGHFMCAVARVLMAKKFENITFAAGGIHGDDMVFPDLIVDGLRVGFYNSSIAKTKRFVPSIGNLRPSTIFGDKLFQGTDVATPKFNQRMLFSILEPQLIQQLEEHLKNHAPARHALLLLKKVLVHRNLEVFSTVILTARIVRLVLQGQITEKQEILTILRIIFNDFVSWSVDDVDYVLPDADELEDNVSEEYSTHFDVNLIYDHLNIASHVTKNQLLRLKKELATCFPLLGQVYTFDGIFIEKLPIFAQFDHYARLQVDAAHLKHLLGELAIDSVDSGDIIDQFIRNLEHRIAKTMGERYEFFGINEISTGGHTVTWSTSDYAPECNQKTFIIGFRSTSSWKNPLTVGPSAQTAAAKEFRELWKDTSELRKFADTRICECVVWSEAPSDKVPRAILQFVLQKMFEVPAKRLSWRTLGEQDQEYQKKSTEAAAKAFAELSAVLRSLKGLPLMITNVHGISGYLRGSEPAYPSIYAAPCPKSSKDHALPEVGKIPLFSPTITVHIKLEYSGKWGNDVEAIRRLTSSFYVKIAEKLKNEKKLIAVPTIDQLFVLQSGIVFKVVVVHDRILTILEEEVEKLKNSGATRIESSLQGVRLSAWKKKFISEPLLQLSLQSFSTSHKFFGSTVQLFKRWLGSKLLSGHLNDHIIELLVVAAINSKGHLEPQSIWCSFARLLHLISTHPWPARPLIVDFGSKTWNEEKRAKLEESFIKMRPILPPMVVIHEEDHLGSKFTREHPQGIVLNRLVALAQEALRILEKHTIGEKSLDLEASLLNENLAPYDAVIELEPTAVVRKKALLERRPQKFEKIPVVELDPIDELVYQLNNNFHQVAMFFYNKYGGHRIGIMFKPHESEVPAKISRCNLHKSVSETTLRLNKEEILENIQILGEGIVAGVTLQKP